MPVFVFGDSISGRPDLETVVDGNAELRRGPTAIRADRVEYYQPEDTVKATGNVRISSAGNQYRGPALQIKLDTFEGFFTQPSYRFLAQGGNGQASRIDFVDDKRMVAHNATFTTCERGDEKTWQPAWIITGTRFKFDQEAETGEATNAARKAANQGKDKAAEALSGLSKIANEAAGTVDQHLGKTYGDYARKASTGVENVATKLQAKNVDELAAEATDFVKKRPAIAIGALAAVGLLLVGLFTGGRKKNDDVA